jgi:hypothetical protein
MGLLFGYARLGPTISFGLDSDAHTPCTGSPKPPLHVDGARIRGFLLGGAIMAGPSGSPAVGTSSRFSAGDLAKAPSRSLGNGCRRSTAQPGDSRIPRSSAMSSGDSAGPRSFALPDGSGSVPPLWGNFENHSHI